MGEIRITVLVENTVSRPGLLAEHGLAFWVEAPGGRVLMDTGAGTALPHNAAVLGAPVHCTDAVVLSHGHDDHTGGLPWALAQAPRARVVRHPEAVASHFSRRGGRSHAIGLSDATRSALGTHGGSVLLSAGPTELVPGVFVTGTVPRRHAIEDVGGPFFLDAEGTRPDPIADDQAVWIEAGAGVVVLLGCAHSGVINTLEYIRELTGGKPFRAVLGGMHLNAASEERLAWTLDALRRLAPGRLGPCHCTGAGAMERIQAECGDRYATCGAGTRVVLGV